jgi:hypothetical protein
MSDDANAKRTSQRRPPWFAITRILFAAILIAVIYLLAQDMVRHRFFRGGWINHQHRLMP